MTWIEDESSMPNRIQLNLVQEGSDKVKASVVVMKSRILGRGGHVEGSLLVRRPFASATEATNRTELERQIEEARLPVPVELPRLVRRVAAAWGTRPYFDIE